MHAITCIWIKKSFFLNIFSIICIESNLNNLKEEIAEGKITQRHKDTEINDERGTLTQEKKKQLKRTKRSW